MTTILPVQHLCFRYSTLSVLWNIIALSPESSFCGSLPHHLASRMIKWFSYNIHRSILWPQVYPTQSRLKRLSLSHMLKLLGKRQKFLWVANMLGCIYGVTPTHLCKFISRICQKKEAHREKKMSFVFYKRYGNKHIPNNNCLYLNTSILSLKILQKYSWFTALC